MHCCVPGTLCFEYAKGLPAALITLVIGVVGGWIAYNQYKVAQAKLKLDLFEKRLAIFQQTWEILSETVTKGTKEKHWGLGTPFNNMLPNTLFLFGQEMHDFLVECSHKWVDLNAFEAEDDTASRAQNAFKASNLRVWFHDESGKLKQRFAPFLDFQNWK